VIVATTPPLLAHLVDEGTTDIDDDYDLIEAVEEYRRHRAAWYGGVIGLLVVRASAAPTLVRSGTVAGLRLAVIADTGLDRLGDAVAALREAGAVVPRAEVAVAKRGEDPVPGVRRLLAAADSFPGTAVHAEIPLTGGLLDALDLLAEHRTGPDEPAATFRVGGLAGELFPPPTVLAGVICACRDRGVRFTICAGVTRALRHSDHETGFAHHGALNVLAACLAAASGAGVSAVADRLASADPVGLVEAVRAARNAPRPLCLAFTSARVADTVTDLEILEVISRPRSGADDAASDAPVAG
jgi:hypothetical protein